jgi:GT2 family glycosyltransferase
VAWYAVGGVLGCALLLTRACLEAAGSFDEAFFAYYEEVDLCLRARRHGFQIVCNPRAVATHDGLRGFLAGFTPLSAELKARNLLRLMRHWATLADWVVLAPTYALLLSGSIVLYGLRGRADIVVALLRGTVAGWRRRGGPLPAAVRAG